MPDTIQIPGIGPTNKKYVYIGAAGIAGFVGYAYWRNKKASAAADSTTPTDTSNTNTTDTSALDSANAAANDPYAYGSGGDYYFGGTPTYQAPYYPNPYYPTGNSPISDPEWVQACEQYLTNVGVDSQAASHALSLYLANLCMTNTEADYVRQAIAGVGEPPQSHHTIQICSSTPPPTGGGSTPTNLPTAGFTKVKTATSWDNLARSHNVFGGNGRALYQFNLLPGKHQAGSYAAVQSSWPTIKAHQSWEVALPVKGKKVNLPGIGDITS